MNAIEISNLSKSFKGKKGSRVAALKNLDLTVNQGEIFGFLGPNGAGKSTTIKTLMGLIRPSSGSARLLGAEISSPAARLKVGFLPENPSFYDYLTAEEYLNFVGQTFKISGAILPERVTHALKLLELWDARKRAIRGYSKGMVQRLGLAQTILHDPDLYILDEPMSGLDPVGRALVKDLMLDLKRRGKTIFFSTHVIADVEAVCDRVAILVKGELRAENVVSELMSEGIVGYVIRLEQTIPVELQEFMTETAAIEKGDLYVPRKQFNLFMNKVDRLGCTVHLIEPKRNSLEDFFLKIIS